MNGEKGGIEKYCKNLGTQWKLFGTVGWDVEGWEKRDWEKVEWEMGLIKRGHIYRGW